jgi:hypothetical protein
MAMTPKEKAQELVDKNYQIFEDDEDEHFIGTSKRISKLSALIAVDEIIKLPKAIGIDNLIEYWEEVKQEIEKL